MFVCVILGIGSIYFTSDANKLVLNPIERMLEKVRFIAANPLAAATDEVDNAGMMSMMYKQQQSKVKENKDSQYET